MVRLEQEVKQQSNRLPTAKLLDYSKEEWERVQQVNLKGVLVCIKCEVEQMLNQEGGGSIVSTSSAAGLTGIPGAISYNAAKHGATGIRKAIALKYASRNIRVIAGCPGYIET